MRNRILPLIVLLAATAALLGGIGWTNRPLSEEAYRAQCAAYSATLPAGTFGAVLTADKAVGTQVIGGVEWIDYEPGCLAPYLPQARIIRSVSTCENHVDIAFVSRRDEDVVQRYTDGELTCQAVYDSRTDRLVAVSREEVAIHEHFFATSKQ